MTKVRVYELAKGLGIESKTVLSMLKDMGEFVRSASSVIPPPVERRLRERLARIPESSKVAGRTGLSQRPNPTPTVRATSQPPRVRTQVTEIEPIRAKPRPSKWYKGDPPSPLVRHLLDKYVTKRRTAEDLDHLRPGKYFLREVREAKELASYWGWALMSGWTYDDIVEWAHTRIPVEQADAIKQAGLTPSELGWHWEDGQRGDLQWRLMRGSMTVDQVILEAIARRARAS